MVDLGISRTQDIQNPLPAAPANPPPGGQERPSRPVAAKVRHAPSEAAAPEGHALDLETEVRRLNSLLGSDTRIRFVINRSTNNVYVEVVDKESNEVLKTIPPSELKAVAGRLTGGGILVDKRF